MAWDRILTDLGFRAAARATKFVAYYQLVDACAQRGCPVCRCVRDTGFRALDGLLYEQVTDPETRAVLDRSWGLCNWHAWMTRDVKNAGLGIAIIYADLLAGVRDRLAATERQLAASRPRGGWRRRWQRIEPLRLVEARARRARCALCQLLGEAETGYLHVVLDYLEEPDFDRAYARSAGLCLPHLTRALTAFPDHTRHAALLARTLRALEELARDLRGFVDKHDHAKRAPFTDAEAAAWTGALGFVSGQPELFGNEMPREADPAGRRPAVAAAPEPTAAPPPGRDALAAERTELERQLTELHRQLADHSARAASLQYRLRIVEEDRKALELNLAGERANSRTWEGLVRELRAEIADLRRRLDEPEPPPDAAA